MFSALTTAKMETTTCHMLRWIMPMVPVIERIWIMVVGKIWINFTWKTTYVRYIRHSQFTTPDYSQPTKKSFCRISRIHRWCHWNLQHMAAMMLVSSPAAHGHIYSVVFMNRITYHMLWAMHRALGKAYRLVNKNKPFRWHGLCQFVWIVYQIRWRPTDYWALRYKIE